MTRGVDRAADPLVIRQDGRSGGEAVMTDFFHPLPGDWTVFRTDGGSRLARCVGRREASRIAWRIDGFEIGPGQSLVALDRSLFEADDREFREIAHLREEGGPNLHPEPVRLPLRLRSGQWHPLPHAGLARVCLGYVGRVEISSGGLACGVRAMRLDAEGPQGRVSQWYAEGLGEIAMGPADGPFGRWLHAYRSDGGATFLRDVDRSLTGGRLPSLPGEDGSPCACP